MLPTYITAGFQSYQAGKQLQASFFSLIENKQALNFLAISVKSPFDAFTVGEVLYF